MPGINTIISYENNINNYDKNLNDILAKMNYDDTYYHEIIFKNSNMKIIFSGYKEYPYKIIKSNNKLILIDGAIYNKTDNQIKNQLLKIIPPIMKGLTKNTELISDFVTSTDGEYVIYFIDTEISTLVILNDGLGRLPLYYYHDHNKFISGRALKFVVQNLLSVNLDDKALLEYFLFFVPLGNKTLFKNIFRLFPASIIITNYKTRQYNLYKTYSYNFDERLEEPGLKYYTNILYDSFMQSTIWRKDYFRDRRSLIALSGGLDSRAVLMSLIKCGIDFEAITFRDFYNITKRDLPVVNEIVKKYNIKNKLFDLPRNNIKHMENLIFLKDGMNLNEIMGFVLFSLELIVKEYGKNIVWYTGDGGGYIVGPRYFGKKIKSMHQLVNNLIERNSIHKLDTIAMILKKSSKSIINYLCDYFSTYPEQNFIHKYDRFFFFEHLFKFSMEAEDRVRHYYWLTTPHYGIDFTLFAFKIKNSLLDNWIIYKEFLKSLDENCIKIKYANWGLPLSSPLLPIYLPIREIATRNMRFKNNIIKVLRFIKDPTIYGKKVKENQDVIELREYLNMLVNTDDFIKSYIDIGYLLKMASNEKSTYRMYSLINIIKYLNLVENKKV